MNWYVLYTKSRNEKKVAEQLERLDIDVFCPCLKIEKQWSDRKKVVEEPLFRSYVFVRLLDHERRKVFSAQGVVGYLNWLQKPAIVRDTEIEAIKEMLKSYDHAEIEVSGLSQNDRVAFKSGPLKDHEGVIKQQNGKVLTVYVPSLEMKVRVDMRQNKIARITNRVS